jgi:hypothetical protein
MRLIRINYFIVFVVSLLFITQAIVNAEGNEKGKRTLQKVQQQVPVTFLDINNIFVPMRNNGISDIDINQQNSGLVFPKGSGKTAAFTSGLLWGAKIPGDPQVRVGGTAYATGLQPGAILADGTADDPTLDKYRIYRVRPDVYPGGPTVDLSNAAQLEGASESAIRDQYELDWTEWPADLGAPYFDADSNGTYDPTVDIPGVPGADQTLWFIANDLNPVNTADLYGASPMGIEAKVTYWAYNQSGALGNMYFRKYVLSNKGAQQDTLKDMYVSMWSDVDLGNAGDDFVGVDTVLSLQYCYNASATDATYAPLPPPAVGFDFFQGPLVDGVAGEDKNKNGVDDAEDFGIFNGQVVGPGKINLPMTAAYYFANGDPNIGDPPQGDLDGSTQFYNFFQGKFGLSGQTFTDLVTGQPTTYALNGDPVARTGWLDGIQLPPGDRRQGSASGPFTLAPGETQEVVVAEICAGAIPGVDRLSAISLLKFYDQIAQVAYDTFFDLPTAPPAPEVVVSELNEEIVLDWSRNTQKVMNTEGSNNKGYVFQGYNVYQLPSSSATISEGVRVATYDIIDGIGKIFDNVFDPNTGSVVKLPVQFGNDTGIKRYISIKNDAVKGGTPLINGIKYYFAVTAYSYNPDPLAIPNNLENPISIITIVPHTNDPGVTYGSTYGDTLSVVHTTGSSDGIVSPFVVDPSALIGDDYLVKFSNPDDSSEFAVASQWELFDVTKNQTIYTSDNLSGDGNGQIDSINYYPVIDGFYLVVAGPPEAVNSYSTTGTRWITGTDFGLESFFGGLGVGKNFFGSDLPASEYYPVEMKWVGGPDEPSEANGWSQGATYRRDSSYAFGGIGWMPFTVWNVSDPNNPIQINACFVEDKNNGSANLKWDMGWDGTQFKPTGGREYIFMNNTPYDPQYYVDKDGTYDDVLYALGPGARGSHPYLEAEWTMTIIPNYAVLVTDSYTFSSIAPAYSDALARDQVNKINVFPNPYYGVNSEEINKYNRFVTFSHLPDKATIRIFNLAGVLVKTINKDNQDQFQRWDLANESGLPVASGLYIAYIEMPDIGTTKILKVAIIQEQQILDRF